ncbi:hypothetical protein CGLO_14096 [Colletotrichum gloeosporioides Cg-14]|uniref:Uncharacterized protein n=1 Tax=Colletotrichum gloeosporioides (strain Cg-14) TaxID=1237896 RepID=T0L5I6_COLGC|nr:hypothetical protein CGLO_14096 [Colletotrichum gloeosporioides Cg-14]
MAKMNCSF